MHAVFFCASQELCNAFRCLQSVDSFLRMHFFSETYVSLFLTHFSTVDVDEIFSHSVLFFSVSRCMCVCVCLRAWTCGVVCYVTYGFVFMPKIGLSVWHTASLDPHRVCLVYLIRPAVNVPGLFFVWLLSNTLLLELLLQSLSITTTTSITNTTTYYYCYCCYHKLRICDYRFLNSRILQNF